MTYCEHLAHSWGIAVEFAALCAKALVHGAVPGMFRTSSTDGVTRTLPSLLGTDGRAEGRAT